MKQQKPLRIWLAGLVALASATASRGANPEKALRAHTLVESWVRAWAVPQGIDGAFDLDAAGVCVTLRLDGQIVGRGQVMFEGDSALADAARMAWDDANQRLVPERDALRDERVRDAAQRLTVDLEVAQTLTPLFGDTIARAAASAGPGHDGVAARKGERIDAVFPGTMLARNATPGEALRSVVSELTGPLTSLADARSEGVIVYRFDTMRIAQASPDSAGVFLSRGGRVRSLRSVDPGSIRDFGDRVEANMLTRLWPGDEPLGLLGTYEPWTGEFEEPMLAPARDQAMAAFALARWARVRSEDDESAFARMAPAVRILEDLASVHASEESPALDQIASSLTILALHEVSSVAPKQSLSPALADLRGQVQKVVEATNGGPRGLHMKDDGFADGLTPAEKAVNANALAVLGIGQEPIRALLRETNPAMISGLMPWIGWAMEEAWPVGEALPGANALIDFRALCWRHQLRGSDLAARDEDLAGGIVFTSGGNPLPTAQTVRPLAFIATMLGDSRLTTDEELLPELGRLAESIRFLMQLEMGPVEAGLYRSPERTEGGIRLALWDSRLRLDSSALTLLTLAETVNSLQKRTGEAREADN